MPRVILSQRLLATNVSKIESNQSNLSLKRGVFNIAVGSLADDAIIATGSLDV